MRQREQALANLLKLAGEQVGNYGLRVPDTAATRCSAYHAEVETIYRAFGGRQEEPTLRPGTWDLQVTGMAVELDEEQHFNRYRLATLAASVYQHLPTFPLAAYRTHCARHEADCLKIGRGRKGFWTNESCERQFGSAGIAGQLDGPGAPRWKQRALYDFLKDLAPLVLGVAVVRVAVWDAVWVDGHSLDIGLVLDRQEASAASALATLIRARQPK
jgi:hypothetical protein